MDRVERTRLTRAVGLGSGIHLLLLLVLLLVPLAPKEEKIPLGAIKVELGPGLDNRAGQAASPPPASADAPSTPPRSPQAPETVRPTPSTPANLPPARTPRNSPSTPASPASRPSEAPAPSAPAVRTPAPPGVDQPPATNQSLSASSRKPASTQALEGLDNLSDLFADTPADQGQSQAPGKTKFEDKDGNPVELENGVYNARPLPLRAPVLQDYIPPGNLEVTFVIGPLGLLKLDQLQFRALSGPLAMEPQTSESWRLMKKAVEEALSNWTFITDGREIRGKVLFTIQARR